MTENQKPVQVEKAKTETKGRTRSPAYPAHSLKVAIERVKTVWEKEKQGAAPPDALAHDWDLNPKSSATLLLISSLKKFGLLEEVEGKDRKLAVTDTALNIILADSE